MDNTCVCCGRIIPEGRQICLHCGDYDDMQVFKEVEQIDEQGVSDAIPRGDAPDTGDHGAPC